MSTFGDNLRSRRQAAHLSLRSLATMTGISNAFLCQIEKHGRPCSSDRLQKIAAALGCSTHDLLGEAYTKPTYTTPLNGSDFRGLSCRSFAKLWEVDAEWEPAGKYCVRIFEPLDVNVPPTARPYWRYDKAEFYDHTGNNKLTWESRHHDLMGIGDTLIILRDRHVWYEVTGGQFVYRVGRWMIQWLGYSNTPRSTMMNLGMPGFRDPSGHVEAVRMTANTEPSAEAKGAS